MNRATLFLILGLCSCGEGTPDEEPHYAREIGAKEDAVLVGDSWTPNVLLKDDSTMFSNGKPTGGWFVTPIHTTLLTDGRVLVTGWSRHDQYNCGPHGTRQNGETFVLDPNSVGSGGTFMVSPIDEAPQTAGDVLYCSGQVTLAAGRVFYLGGASYVNLGDPHELEFGLNYARIFDPTNLTFSRVPDLLDGGPVGQEGLHWYATATRLPNGRVLTTGGFTECCDGKFANLSMHTFDPQLANAGLRPWNLLVSQQHGDGDTTPGLRDYTHTVLLPKTVNVGGLDRDIVMMGWNGKMIFFSSADGLSEASRFAARPNTQRPINAAAWDSSAALVSTGEVMTSGGTSDPNVARRAHFYNPQTDKWTALDTGIGRHNPATVLLPDGTVLLLSGENDQTPFPGDRRMPQVIDPVAKTVKTMGIWPNDANERGYHNFALLLKDGRVLVGGGTSSQGGIGCERPDLRIYMPSYFSGGARPVVSGVSEPLAFQIGGAPVTLGLSKGPLRPTGGVVLMATGSFTHSFDQNQRYVPLSFTQSPSSVHVTLPSDPRVAPPGEYILYFIGKNGVPSLGKHVHLD